MYFSFDWGTPQDLRSNLDILVEQIGVSFNLSTN
jgi:hypothetical protein